jgi:hypothetical protein
VLGADFKFDALLKYDVVSKDHVLGGDFIE